MLQIVWSARSLEDLDNIASYVAQENESAAEALRDRIENSVLPAAQFPYMFRAGRVPNTREIVAHPNYIIVYRVLTDRIRVLRVGHSRRQYPWPTR